MSGTGFLARARSWARSLKQNVVALWLAARDPRTPWYARLAAALVAAYALSPIDLIPDFIPILGYLDELIILPLGIWLAIRLVPADVLAEMRAKAAQRAGRPRSWAAAAFIIALWIALAAVFAVYWLA